ncbi:ribonuclease H-like domain-containing protein [Tanacetum coccineum]
MLDEYNALVTNGTWVLVPRPTNVNVVRSIWHFNHKFKAYLIANGQSQQQGINYDETFSPVVKPAIIHTVLSLTVSRDWPNHQLDVKNAFIHGHLSEMVYMYQPLGFVDPTRPDYDYDTESELGPDDDPVSDSTLYRSLPHFAALNRIIWNVHGTLDHGLQMHVSNTTQLIAYTDADWAKAEYKGVTNVVDETTWIRNLLLELHAPLHTATLVYCDIVIADYLYTNQISSPKVFRVPYFLSFVPVLLGSQKVSFTSIISLDSSEHGRMILESVEHGLLIWPTIKENGVTMTKKYIELSVTEKIQADCDLKETNIILHGLPSDVYSLVNHHRVAKDLWKRV